MSGVLELLPDTILGALGREKILSFTSQLPFCALESTFGFECHLSDPSSELDFFLSVLPESEFANFLIGSADTSCSSTASSIGLARFLREMARSDSFLSQWFRSIILEYDLVAVEPTQEPAPGIFIEPTGTRLTDPVSIPNNNGDGYRCNPGILASALCWVTGRKEELSDFDALARMVRSLPPGGEVIHLGALPRGDAGTVRIVLKLAKSQVVSLFRDLKWEGSLSQLARLIELCERWQSSDKIGIACDVSARGVSTRVGIELQLREAWLNSGIRPWAPLLGHFVEKGFCIRDKAESLLSLPKADTLLHGKGAFRLLTGINHLKLVLDEEQVRSKAYLGMFLLPR